ncbi:MAG: TonB-dependent receptor [Gemmatimonadetes bacterium]|nr:TonB-dependent receptor [Gemmatimonadota bacterium]NNF38782.1 TonB-dependent receptor [Gemmatimonadota bacterium]NNK64080.1 TonB-dependent receptor [Gemmatimonadota bacterium]
MRTALPFAAVLFCLVAPLSAQAPPADQDPPSDTTVYAIDPLLVTATRGPRLVSETPRPVSVLGRVEVREQSPNTVSDLFRRLPGLDVTGVGVNQARPAIRGQRGQRILLLQDGMRMNNSRRQQDFGELPALVDVSGVDRVEIVRGPASVLYGSDAIGGVINIITREPEADGFQGLVSARYGQVENQGKGAARIFGRQGRLTVQAGGTWRSADSYEAPSGSFGSIELDEDVTVLNSGVSDRSGDLRLGWDLAENVHAFGKFEYYTAEDAGFGSVAPADFAPGEAEINLLYPDQRFAKFTAGFRADEMGTALADRLEIVGYGQDNQRTFVNNLAFSFGIPNAPEAGLRIEGENFTDIRTYGFRAEARKLAASSLLLTYGVDLFRDRAEGTDFETQTTVGFGPPMVETDDTPSLPTATFLNAGTFVQGEVDVGERLTLVGGGRYTWIRANTFRTEGLDADPLESSDGTFVAAVNGIYRASDEISVVAAVGRAFRAPNLIERFFDGSATGGYQVANPELEPETSTNVDLGLRFRTDRVGLEIFGFRNQIRDGIRIAALDDQVDGQDAFQNVNVERLRYQGVEVSGDVRFGNGLMVLGSFSTLDSEDVDDPENPVGDSFSSKTTAALRYDSPSRRFWAQIDGRWQGEQREVDLGDNPLGDILPAFDVYNLRGGLRLFETESTLHRLNVAVTNLTDALYAEATNASFFRPEPKRNITLSYEVSF